MKGNYRGLGLASRSQLRNVEFSTYPDTQIPRERLRFGFAELSCAACAYQSELCEADTQRIAPIKRRAHVRELSRLRFGFTELAEECGPQLVQHVHTNLNYGTQHTSENNGTCIPIRIMVQGLPVKIITHSTPVRIMVHSFTSEDYGTQLYQQEL